MCFFFLWAVASVKKSSFSSTVSFRLGNILALSIFLTWFSFSSSTHTEAFLIFSVTAVVLVFAVSFSRSGEIACCLRGSGVFCLPALLPVGLEPFISGIGRWFHNYSEFLHFRV